MWPKLIVGHWSPLVVVEKLQFFYVRDTDILSFIHAPSGIY
jgi:hypothetical protein